MEGLSLDLHRLERGPAVGGEGSEGQGGACLKHMACVGRGVGEGWDLRLELVCAG